MSNTDLGILSQEIHRILGSPVSDQHLNDLLELKPLTIQSLNRLFQTKARIQLKKGQHDRIVQAVNMARAGEKQPTPVLSLQSEADPDLSALPTPEGRAFAHVLRNILQEVDFDLVNHNLRLLEFGGDYDIRPFPLPTSPVDVQAMKVRLRQAAKTSRNVDDARFARRIQYAFAFFMFGESLNRKALEDLFGEDCTQTLDEGLRLGLFIKADGRAIRMNGLSLFSKKLRNSDVIYIFADTPPHFETRAAHQRVYIGADSFELMARVSETPDIAGYCVEMGSGSGIQLIAALKQHPAITKSIGKERDRRAVHVSLFNAALNRVDDKMSVVDADNALRGELDGELVSFAMTNPPFIAMPGSIKIDSEDRSELDLRTMFPEAGWGGEDGLQVTKQFVNVLRPLLRPESQLVIYSQFAGDSKGPTILRDHVQRVGGFDFVFEPVKSRTLVAMQPETGDVVEGQTRKVLSVDETALSVARLIVAALLAKQEPQRLRVAIRKGGAEHALLLTCARRIDESYRTQGITHFHDGFAILTRQSSK